MSNTIGSNRLGVEGRQKPLGYLLLASGVACVLFVAFRILFLVDSTWDAILLVTLAILVPFGFRRCWTGAHIALDVINDVVGPANLENQQVTAEELLTHRRIWTYLKPKTLLEKLWFASDPRYGFLTPPYQRILSDLPLLIVVAFVSFGLAIFFHVSFMLLVGVACVGLSFRLYFSTVAVRTLPESQPPVEVFEHQIHLQRAGSPIDLFNDLKFRFDDLRESDFQNRVITVREPDLGVNAQQNSFTSNFLIETQPVSSNKRTSNAFNPLAIGVIGCAFEMMGTGMAVFAPVFVSDLLLRVLFVLYGSLILLEGTRLFLIFQNLQSTFSFRSDLFQIEMSGSYVENRVSVGGGLLGLPATEGTSLKSDIYVYARGARIYSEASLNKSSVGAGIYADSQPIESVLQKSPRYIVAAENDPAFSERVNHVLMGIKTYQDNSEDLRTPNLHSQEVQQLLANNILIAGATQAAISQNVTGGTMNLGFQNPPALQSSGASPAPQQKVTSIPQAQVKPAADKNKITWQCLKCKTDCSAPKVFAGKKTKCKSCKFEQTIPSK